MTHDAVSRAPGPRPAVLKHPGSTPRAPNFFSAKTVRARGIQKEPSARCAKTTGKATGAFAPAHKRKRLLFLIDMIPDDGRVLDVMCESNVRESGQSSADGGGAFPERFSDDEPDFLFWNASGTQKSVAGEKKDESC